MVFWIVILFLLAIFVFIIGKFCLIIINQSKVGVIERLGSFHKIAHSGINFIMPFTDRLVTQIDMKEQVRDFPPQPVITRDNVTMMINTIVYYQVTDPQKLQYEISDIEGAIENMAATTLRNVIGELELDETLSSRDTINDRLRNVLDDVTDKWGVKINRVELKDISLAEDIQGSMETQMKAERDKRAQILISEGKRESTIKEAEGEREAAIIRAQGEKEAAVLKAQGEAETHRIIQQAKADMIKEVYKAIHEGNPDERVITLRYLESLEKIADGQASKIYMPLQWGKILANLSGFLDLKDQ
ncbi:MAG: SPFH/Band 7/PHB domain protein [Halanaerobiales bacterium]|nr:SPFH/Band 7/PHB domain protein [Halanaerobiales bacterium]